jgi:hypothetical protein
MCGKRSHVFVPTKTDELGSWNFASVDEQNIPDHKSDTKAPLRGYFHTRHCRTRLAEASRGGRC